MKPSDTHRHPSAPALDALEPRLLLSAGTIGGEINLHDLATAWGQAGVQLPADLNADGRVDVGDLGILAARQAQPVAAVSALLPDPLLESAARYELGIHDRPLTADDLSAIEQLLPTGPLWSLEGLQYCTNLRILGAWGTITDLTPLAGLTKLEHLYLHQSWISDLSPLAGLTGLRHLGLSRNRIDNLGPLAGMTELVSLDLSDNDIVHLTPLANLDKLEWLNLWRNQVTSLAGLEGLDRLRELEAMHNQIDDVSAMAGMTSLEVAHLEHNAITDVAALSGLENLREVKLSANAVTHLPADMSLPSLEELDLDDNQLVEAAGLANMPSLQSLNLQDNRLASLPDLSALTELKVLHLDGNRISDVAPLSHVDGLERLGLEGNPVAILTPLAGMNLKSLGVSHTDVTDLTALAGMNLRSLYVSHTDVTDLTPLAGMNLKSLDVSHTDVTDLAPLAGFDRLHMLFADGTRVSDLSPLAGLRMTWLSINDARIAELPADLPQRAGHLSLTGNQITDLAPLVSSGVLSSGDQLLVSDNPLSAEATDAQIPALRRRGVEVLYATPDDHEDNDQPQSATPLPPGQASLVASFHTPADEDWYSFTLAGEMEARLTLSYPTDLRFPGYELYRSEGEGTENLVPLDHATTRSILFGSGHRLSLPAGTYLLRLFDRGVSLTEPLRQRVYEISLDVEHPGPEAEVTLPVRYGLGRDEIDLLGLAAGRTHVERIIITNRGSRPLPIEALSVAGEGLRLEPLGQDPAGVVLQPGETILTGLTVPTDDLGPMTGELVLSAVNGESWSWPISGVVETPVNVPDPTLRWLLENTVNRAGFALTPTTLASVRHLTFVLFGNWPEAPIRSLVGLEACTGLETLRLVEKTDLNDLSPMAELPSLRHFTLQLPHDIDLSPLANLESLETLNLAETPITNLQPLVDGSALEAGDALTIGSGLNRWETGFLSRPIVLEHIPQLQARGVRVFRESHYRGPAYDHPQTARRIGFGQPYRLAMGTEAEMLEVFGPYHGDDLSEIGPDRWFTIDLWEDSNVIIQTGALAGDTQVELFDGQDLDQPLAVSDAGGFARIERTGQQALGPGTYLLRVTGDGPVRGGTISVWRGPWRDGDINGDSRVDVGDLGILAANWQRTDAAWADGDLTGDLVVDAGDLGILADSWTG